MEGNNGSRGFSSYFQARGDRPLATGSIFYSPAPNSNNNPNVSSSSSFSEDLSFVFPPHSVGGRTTATATTTTSITTVPGVARRKRGRPRKYGLGADGSVNPAAVSLPPSAVDTKKKPGSQKASQMAALGNAGQGFTPHVIWVAVGEDVSKKIMSFMQQQKHAICIISANGSISNASLRQPAMTGGTITYEGRFEILSLSGSFLHSEIGGASSRTGGLSVCLSGADGCIVGGGVGGPLIAASPVQIVVCSFVIDGEKDFSQAEKTESSVVKSPSSFPGTSITPLSFRAVSDSRTLGRGNSQEMMESGSMFQSPLVVNPRLTYWSGHINLDGKFPSFTGRADHQQSHNDGHDHLQN